MISATRATKILTESDQGRRSIMIDALSEEDAKHLLKQALKVIRGDGQK